jgi:hypothetical protein
MLFNLSDQLSGSFEELMAEIRAMRQELERVRALLEDQAVAPATPVRARRTTQAPARHRKTSAA